jgi:fluoride exporter
MKYFIVSLGSAIGGGLRYWLSSFVYKFLPLTFPFGTLLVNILGSFLLGFIIFYLDARELLSNNFKLFLTIGFCGGFTTFSTFSLETFNLIKESQFLFAGLNIIVSFIFSIAGVYLAYLVSR